MDRERFDHLLAAYGGDFGRWPPEERASAAAFVAHDAAAAALREAQTLDGALDLARDEVGDTSALAARILTQTPRAKPWLDRRAMLALAACAVFGVVLGYSGGRLAPVADQDDAFFSAAFEAPLPAGEEG